MGRRWGFLGTLCSKQMCPPPAPIPRRRGPEGHVRRPRLPRRAGHRAGGLWRGQHARPPGSRWARAPGSGWEASRRDGPPCAATYRTPLPLHASIGTLPNRASCLLAGWLPWLKEQRRKGVLIYLGSQCTIARLDPHLYKSGSAALRLGVESGHTQARRRADRPGAPWLVPSPCGAPAPLRPLLLTGAANACLTLHADDTRGGGGQDDAVPEAPRPAAGNAAGRGALSGERRAAGRPAALSCCICKHRPVPLPCVH